jgi:hypothetical protein
MDLMVKMVRPDAMAVLVLMVLMAVMVLVD